MRTAVEPSGPLASAAYDYPLPPEFIAQRGAEPRDSARLLRVRGGSHEHRTFADLPEYFESGDVLVINETRVIRARVFGRRVPGGGRIETFFLHPANGLRFDPAATEWAVLMRPARKMQVGSSVEFASGSAEVTAVADSGLRTVRLHGITIEELLARHGEMPLPPYIASADSAAADAYQTIFARVPGSVAAPTASLHFTPEVFAALTDRGVEIVRLTLDVGLGTFRPIVAERIDQHVMHAESYEISSAAADALAGARRRGARITAAGTTALRALEAAAQEDGSVRCGRGETALYITPGYRFRVVDRLVTNFHLPRSTLLVLVATFAGYGETMNAYRAAVAARYRFFSLGDAMLVERPIGTAAQPS